MKKLALGLVVAAVAGYVAWARLQPPPARLTAALDRAKKEQKLVLLDFTGSDWCGWCIKQDQEALGKPEFLDYAGKYLVTLVVDFPMHHDLAADLKSANAALKSKFDVSGFPTLVALSPDGKVVWTQVGYVGGGPFAVIAPLNRTRMSLGMPPAEGLPAAALAAGPATAAPTPKVGSTSSATPASTATSADPAGRAEAPKLQGVFYSRAQSMVILGGVQCAEGDSVGGMKVVKIMPGKVKVEWEGQMEELSLQ